MTVDRDFQAILDVINALPAPDFTRPPLDLARQFRSNPVKIPPRVHPVSVEVRRIPGKDGHAIPVRIYRPSSPAPHPVLVSVHGGGWVFGSLDADEYRCHLISHLSGCAVVSVDYRLSPEHQFPLALEDCMAVTQWVASEAEAMGFNADRIGIMGDSAGGNLAANVALMARDHGGPRLQCLILLYPVCDDDFDRPSYLEHGTGKVLTRAHMVWFWEQYAGLTGRDRKYLSLLRADDVGGLPPTMILTAENDPLRDEGEEFAEKLRQARIEVESERLEGVVHAFQSLAVTHPKSLDSIGKMAGFAKQHLLAGS